MGVPFVDLDEVEIDRELVRSIPEHLAHRYKVIPVGQERGKLSLAMVDPLNIFAIDDIRLITGFDIEPVIATEKSILENIAFHFGGGSFPEFKKEMLKPLPWYREMNVTGGTMAVTDMKEVTLLLKYTQVNADIIGMLSCVSLTQKFCNDLSKNIEAVYMFPLPAESAVNEFEIVVGERIIKSVIKEKREARKIYTQAKKMGKKAGLLDQERPNIFTVAVANIEPGQTITVNIKYYETIKYEDKSYEFLFPMAITPRYGGRDKKGVPESLEGKTSPPILPPGKDPEREVKIFINLDGGFPLGEVTSPTHSVSVKENGQTKRTIKLSDEKVIPDKDFVLKYSSKGEKEETTLSFYREEKKAGTFMVHLTPKMDYGPEEMIRREIIFVLDRSGSMSGTIIKHAKTALKNCLKTLRAGDSFSIIAFDDRVESLSNKSLNFNEENVKKAYKFLNSIDARGGTEILSALKHAFKMPESKKHLRQIVFLTDGAVWNEDDSLKEINNNLNNSRIFSFGIGPSVNRYFLTKIAEEGRGTCQFIVQSREIEEAVERFSTQMSSPILSDINIECEGVNISDIYPAPVPDVYYGQVLCLLGRFHSSGRGTVRLKGRTGKGIFEQSFTVDFPDKDITYPVIETIWARKHIDLLLDEQRKYPQKKGEIRDEIIGIGLNYNLMSRYTSLVAVEEGEDEKENKEEPVTIDVPQIIPESLDYNAFAPQYGVTSLCCEVHESVQDIALSDFGDIEEDEEEDEIELDRLKELVDEAPIVRVVNLIITQAINDKASNIHIEPRDKNVSVRYRIDGILYEVMSPPKHIHEAITGRIKEMAGLDIGDRKSLQEGKFALKHDNEEYNIRLSILPTVYGEKAVMKISDRKRKVEGIDNIGLSDRMKSDFEEILKSPRGLILFTGPAKSKKTETVYNGLHILNSPEKNICTIEDMIEYRLAGINQVQLNNTGGMTFETVLKTILNQDADIIMTGSLEDEKDASLSVRAAFKHLILSTITADESFEAVKRLLNMGIKPFALSSVLKGIVSQKLLRKICFNCKEIYKAPKEILEKLKINDENTVFYHGRGCDICKNTGYKGRQTVFEIIPADKAIKSLIMQNGSCTEFKKILIKNKITAIEEEGVRLILEGITTIEEYFRVFEI